MTTLQADARETPGEWTGDETPDAHPVMAVVVFIIVMLAAIALRGFGVLPVGSFVALTIGTVVLALIVWAIAYVATLRHASLLWRLASLGGFTFFALISVAGQMVGDLLATKYDMGMLAELTPGGDRTIALPPFPNRGPVSRIMVRYVTLTNPLKRELTMSINGIGMQSINSPWKLQTNPDLIKDCARFARARGTIASTAARLLAHNRRMMGDMQRVTLPPTFRKSLIATLAPEADDLELENTVAIPLLQSQMVEAEGMCIILARQHWKVWGGALILPAPGESVAFNRHIEAWSALSAKGNKRYEYERAKVQQRRARMLAAL